ncbi:uncharacterized protein RHOBADRAFT_52783 [Rhodotorula graminis WP1]|uniref:Uncharacterized protein n=1 Tax=Rhodotorula graminis (strain WP1) TaxID=578459 RepID=A0A194S4T9_RHOGW|nr:uncharacterized protein RHOBADRAFT_52783 [Rhodotorula graminis WP1]KPV75753.1 hypothetical protein RHOBADRAFT_52783 [Rhodotorula graminis WP1]
MLSRSTRAIARATPRTRTFARPSTPVVAAASSSPHLGLAPSPRRHYARPPSFTTPQEPAPAPLPEPGQEPDPAVPLAPLPPTNLPVEDYASPLVHTASFFGQLFRYAVYGSVAIVASAATALVAVHLYVEHVALAPSLNLDDPDDWLAEQPGWSGLHIDKRGGTDPRLGLLARAAIRGAYIAQTWGAGMVASPLSAAPSAAASASPFAVSRMGGDMIGAKHDAAAVVASQGRQVGDGGWLLAEQYLAYALERAARRGIALDDSSLAGAAWERHVDQGGVDRAAVELEERLAGVRERIGGRARLEAARDGWDRIYLALSASPTTDPHPDRAADRAWEARETLVATRKLGELSARIADLWQPGTDERRVENDRAQGYFVGGLVPVLARDGGHSLEGDALDQLVPAGAPTIREQANKHASPLSSFFGFWSRSHPPSSPSSTSTSTADLSPELSHLVALLSRTSPSRALSSPTASDAPSARVLDRPAPQRALVASLVSLETFLARRRDGDVDGASSSSSSAAAPTDAALASAQALQRAALEYARALSPAPAPSPSLPSSSSAALVAPPAPPRDTHTPLEPAHVSRSLSQAYLSTRVAALEAHLAECSLARSALGASSSRGGGLFGGGSKNKPAAAPAPGPADLSLAHGLVRSALARAELAADQSAGLLAVLETERGGRAKDLERAFGESLKRARRDAEKVRELGRGLAAFVDGQQRRQQSA